ncbi:Hypothetical predicted protein, partial [Pelobates cultripes]
VHEFDPSERSVGGKKSHKSAHCIACDAKALEGKKLCGTCLFEVAGSPKDPSPEIMRWIQMAVDKSMEQQRAIRGQEQLLIKIEKMWILMPHFWKLSRKKMKRCIP